MSPFYGTFITLLLPPSHDSGIVKPHAGNHFCVVKIIHSYKNN